MATKKKGLKKAVAPKKSAPKTKASAPKKSAPKTKASAPKKKASAPKKKASAPAVSALVARVAAVDWARRSNGQAAGFAEAFAALATPRSPKDRARALAKIQGLVGSYPIAGLALPFLLELADVGDDAPRADILVLVVDAALWGHPRWIEGGFDPDAGIGADLLAGRARARTYAAFVAGEPLFRRLLGAHEPPTRAAAAFALGWVRGGDDAARRDALLAAARAETDAIARASMLLSLAVLDRGRASPEVDALVAAALDAEPSARAVAAVAASLRPTLRADPRVLATLDSRAIPERISTPWCDGALRPLAGRRTVALVFGEEPAERPESPPPLDPEQQAALRSLLEPALDAAIGELLHARGFPSDEKSLRRLAGIPRKIPEGPHAPVYDRWMTFLETGEGSGASLAAELAREIPLGDAIRVVELMYYAEQENDEEHAGWTAPPVPDAVPAPPDADDYDQPGSVYVWCKGSVDDLVARYAATLREKGYSIWSHGHDGDNDLNQGDVKGDHPDGRELHLGVDARDGLLRTHVEWRRSLFLAVTAALTDLHGGAAMFERLRARAKGDVGMRAAIALVRVGWAIADRAKIPVDPVCDEYAFVSGVSRHYIYWTARAHLDRLDPKRREALVRRFMSEENGDVVFGWVRFAPTPAVKKEATKAVPRTFNMSYYELEGAQRAADVLFQYVDESVHPALEKAVREDQNPQVQVLLLGKLGRLDLVRKALESEYPMARAAAKKVLAERG